MTLEPEVIAGVAMLVAAGRIFFLVAKRAKMERNRREYQTLIRNARRGREGWQPESLPRRPKLHGGK